MSEDVTVKSTGTGTITTITGKTGASAVDHTHKCPTCGDETRTVTIVDSATWIGRKSISIRWACGHYRKIQ